MIACDACQYKIELNHLIDSGDIGVLSITARKVAVLLVCNDRKLADIAPLLEVEDMVRMKNNPDWKCVFTYVQSYYRRFVVQPKQQQEKKEAAEAKAAEEKAKEASAGEEKSKEADETKAEDKGDKKSDAKSE